MGQTADELSRRSGQGLGGSDDVEYVETYETADVYIEEDPDTEEIRVEIQQTRAELSDTIDAIQERLNPQVLMDQAKEQIAETKDHLVDQAKDAVREATIGKAEHMVRNATDTARDTGFSVLDTITQNPIPAALVGLGLTWLFMSRKGSSGSRSYQGDYSYPGYRGGGGAWTDSGMPSSGNYAGRVSYQQDRGSGQMYNQGQGMMGQMADQAQGLVGSAADAAQHAAGDVVDTVQSAAGGLAGTVQSAAGGLAGTAQSAVGGMADRVESAPNQIERMVRDNPLGLGAIALGIGAAVGLALPGTPMESQFMGQARDQVLDQAQDVVLQAGQKVQRVAEEAGHAAQREAQAQKLTA